jgi:nucleotide-binding universal stress UspA family protein
MSYKTILVHLNHEARTHALLSTAIDLATKFEAHLIGLYVFPSYRVSPPIPLPFASELAGQIKGAIKK